MKVIKLVKKKKNKKYLNNNFRIFAIIILMLFFLVPSVYAIFKSTSGSSSSVNLAEWSVELNQTGINNNLTIIPDLLNANYTLNVRSSSEVNVTYDIVVSGIPSDVEIMLDNDGNWETPSSGSYTFTNAGTINYNSQSHENSHILTFKALTTATPSMNNTININVVAKQVI